MWLRLDSSLGQGGGQASVEGVARAGGFDDWAGVDGGDMAGEGGGFDEGSLGAEGEDDVPDAAGEEGERLLRLKRDR